MKDVIIGIPNSIVARNIMNSAFNRTLGLNISKISENALKQVINSLIQSNCQKETKSSFLGKASFLKEGLVDGTGFEPATSAMPTLRSFQTDLPAPKITKR